MKEISSMSINCIIMFVILLSIHSTGLFNLIHHGDEIGVVGIFDLIRFAPTKKENRTTIAPPQNTPNRHTNTASPHVYPFPNLNVGVVRCCRCCRMSHCCSTTVAWVCSQWSIALFTRITLHTNAITPEQQRRDKEHTHRIEQGRIQWGRGVREGEECHCSVSRSRTCGCRTTFVHCCSA